MEAAQILQSNLLDVLFENRNKDYGAYELRQNYNKRLMIAIITTVLVLLSALFFLTFNKTEARYVNVPDNFPPIVIVRTIDEIKKPIELPKPTIGKQQIKTDRLVTPIILKDKLVTEDAITPIASIAAVDNTSHEGVIPDVITNTTTNIEPETLMPVPGMPEGEEPIENVEVQATVNINLWRSHLQRQLERYIEDAANAGMAAGQYTVRVKFVVEKDGSITDVKALNDPGYNLAKGAEEVLKKGPKWIAGQQNSKKVRSYHTQPITFVVSDL